MNKNRIFAHFSSILDTMLNNSLFFDTFFQAPYYMSDIHGSVDDPAIPDNIRINFGATRGCIIDKNYNYVVKFDIEEDNWGSVCDREIDIYSRAVAAGVQDYFAEAIYLGTYIKTIRFYDAWKIERTINWEDYDPEGFDEEFARYEDDFGPIHDVVISIPLYAYPKATTHKYSMGNNKEFEQMAYRITSPMRDRNLAIAIDFIRAYGEEAYHTLTDFLYMEHVNDLHFDNVGDINEHFCLIDYGGYHSGDSEYCSE